MFIILKNRSVEKILVAGLKYFSTSYSIVRGNHRISFHDFKFSWDKKIMHYHDYIEFIFRGKVSRMTNYLNQPTYLNSFAECYELISLMDL